MPHPKRRPFKFRGTLLPHRRRHSFDFSDKIHRRIRPLNFIGSIPADGSTNVSPLIRNIILIFDKSVFDHSVRRHNRFQIHVWEGTKRLEKGIDYHLSRSFAFGGRRKIIIRMTRRLAANTEYTVAIFPHLTSRDGEKLGKTVIIKFKTGRRRIVPPPIEE
jgi:hypothetical protein